MRAVQAEMIIGSVSITLGTFLVPPLPSTAPKHHFRLGERESLGDIIALGQLSAIPYHLSLSVLNPLESRLL
jgi:hypothetical protein